MVMALIDDKTRFQGRSNFIKRRDILEIGEIFRGPLTCHINT